MSSYTQYHLKDVWNAIPIRIDKTKTSQPTLFNIYVTSQTSNQQPLNWAI